MDASLNAKTKAKFLDPGSLESLLLNPLNPKLCCGLCFGLFKKPQVIHCGKGHTFCDECIETHIIGNPRRCPVDGQVFTSKSPNLTVQNMVDELLIRCRYGCGETFAIEAQQQHEQTCSAMAAHCPNGCSERVAQSALADHLPRCSHRKERCECGETMNFIELEGHRRSECLLPVRCEFCGLEAKRKDMGAHHATCERRNTKLLANVLEVFNLDGNVREQFLMELFKAAVGESLPLQFEWKSVDRTWVWVKLKDENDSRLLRKSLEAFGFPYVRAPFDDKMGLLCGKVSHLTFCPPLYKIDCPLHDGPTNTPCPFRHKTGIRGPCVKWKCGVVCDHPSCFYAHPGKQVVKLQCMAGQLNTCKICNRGQHFGWECPLRVGVEKDGAFRALEEVLRAQGGSALLSQIKPMVTRLFPSFPTVLRNNYQDKLRLFLEQYPDRIQLLDMDHPGKGIAKLKDDPKLPVEGSTAPSAASSAGGGMSQSAVSPPASSASAAASHHSSSLLAASSALKPPSSSKYIHPTPNTALPPTRESAGEPMYPLPPLNRPWDAEFEIMPFIRDKVAPYVNEVLSDPMTPRDMLPELSKLEAHLASVDKNSNFRSTIAYMKDVGEAIANMRLKHYEPASASERKRQFSVTIFRLKQHQPVLSRPLHELRKLYDEANAVVQQQQQQQQPGGSSSDHRGTSTLGDALLLAFNNVAHACDVVRGRRGLPLPPMHLHQQQQQPPPGFTASGGGGGGPHSLSSSGLLLLPPQPMPMPSLASSIDEHIERLAYSDGPMPSDLPALAYEYGWPICFHCGSPGHTRFTCTGCARCGRTNHVTDDCTQKYLSCGFCYRYGYTDSYRGHATVQCYYLKEFKAEFAHLQRKTRPEDLHGGGGGGMFSPPGPHHLMAPGPSLGQSPPAMLHHPSSMPVGDKKPSMDFAQQHYQALAAQAQWQQMKDLQIDKVPQSLLLRQDDPSAAAFHLGAGASPDDQHHVEHSVYQTLQNLQAQQFAAQQNGFNSPEEAYGFANQVMRGSPQSIGGSQFGIGRSFGQASAPSFGGLQSGSFPGGSAHQSGSGASVFPPHARSAAPFVPADSPFAGSQQQQLQPPPPMNAALVGGSHPGSYPSSRDGLTGSFGSFNPNQHPHSKNLLSSSFPGFSQLSFPSGQPTSGFPGGFKPPMNGDQ